MLINSNYHSILVFTMSIHETFSHTLNLSLDGLIFSSSDRDFLSSLTVKYLIEYLFSLPASYITCSFTVFLDDSQNLYSKKNSWNDSIDFDYSVLVTIPEDVNLSDLIDYLHELVPLPIIINNVEFFS